MDHQRRVGGGGGRVAAHFPLQMAPLINSCVIVLQALRARGNDGHAFLCWDGTNREWDVWAKEWKSLCTESGIWKTLRRCWLVCLCGTKNAPAKVTVLDTCGVWKGNQNVTLRLDHFGLPGWPQIQWLKDLGEGMTQKSTCCDDGGETEVMQANEHQWLLLPPNAKMLVPFTTKGMSVDTGATIRKCHRLGGWSNRCVFLTVLETGSPSSRCWPSWLLVRALFLSCRWLPLCYNFLCAWAKKKRGLYLLIRTLIPPGEPHPHGLISP